MGSLKDSILRYIDEQLDAIESAPSAWGPPLCVELQVLQLLEFRAVTLFPEREYPHAVLDAYEEFLGRKFPAAAPSPLAVLLEKQSGGRGEEQLIVELAHLLGEFRKQLAHEMSRASQAKPDALAAAHDIVLTLWMRSGVTTPPARALSSYYGAFQGVLRALAKLASTQARASSDLLDHPAPPDLADLADLPDLGDAMDFTLNEVQVIPAGSAPARLIVPLDQTMSAETERVQEALKNIAMVSEWAADPISSVAELGDRLGAQELSPRIAPQVLRLMPGHESAVQTVELSGRLLPCPNPIRIEPSYAMRMLEVIQESKGARHDFDRVGTVRGVDADQRSIRLKGEGRSFKCWITEEALITAAGDSVGERVRAIGHEYKGPGGAVIIVRELRR